MRSLRCSVTVFCWLLALSPMAALAQSSNLPAPSALLKFRPTLAGVEYDTPADPAAIAACKVETVVVQNRSIGYALRDGQGKMMRRFVDNDGNGKMDHWSYYQDGFEVYREVDLDGDRSLDESRWLNSGGTRIAVVTKGKVASWKQISAEESSKVFVQGLVQAQANGDLSLLETVMATPAELQAAGLPKDVTDRVAAAFASRAEKVDALMKGLVGWNAQTVWNRFDGTYPHLIPADPSSGLEKDVTVYENAMIFPGLANAPANANAAPPRLAFLQIPDMIKLGATWKFIELPGAIDPEKPVVASVSGVRAMLFDRANNVQPRDEAVDAALKALVDYDTKNAGLLQGGRADIAKYHVGRIPRLRAVVKASKTAEEQLSYNKQVVDSLVAALRTETWPEGRTMLEKLVDGGGKLGSYSAYSLIGADFAIKNGQPGANVLANQKTWMKDLEDFLAKFSKADEAPEVLLQLASANEFNAEEEQARKQYAKVVESYSGTEAAKKAAGSLRRLDMVGKSYAIKGTGLQGEPIDTAKYRGKTVLVVFWASWATPVKDTLPGLIKAQQKYQDRGLEIIGVNLDNERADVEAFLKANPLAWPQIFEGGGMETRLAIEYGITSVPTMFLIDSQGKVVSRNLRTATEVDGQLEKLLADQKPSAGVALDQR
ncbi:MAG: redoxin domain-containing protein [Isosphaeraceae bacterium]